MNGFGAEGGKTLGDALKVNRTLQKLDASYCRLPTECIGSIAHGLMHNDHLKIIDVSFRSHISVLTKSVCFLYLKQDSKPLKRLLLWLNAHVYEISNPINIRTIFLPLQLSYNCFRAEETLELLKGIEKNEVSQLSLLHLGVSLRCFLYPIYLSVYLTDLELSNQA